MQENLYREFKRFEHSPSPCHHTGLRQHFKNYYAVLFSDSIAYSTLRIYAPAHIFLRPLWGLALLWEGQCKPWGFTHEVCAMSAGTHRLATEGQGWSLSGA